MLNHRRVSVALFLNAPTAINLPIYAWQRY